MGRGVLTTPPLSSQVQESKSSSGLHAVVVCLFSCVSTHIRQEARTLQTISFKNVPNIVQTIVSLKAFGYENITLNNTWSTQQGS